MIRNKKAQEEEAGLLIAGLGVVLVAGLLLYLFTVPLRGHVVRESATPFAETEHAISTTSYISILLETRDDYGVKYSALIQNALSNPIAVHPSQKTYGSYFPDVMNNDICPWLKDNVGSDHYFFVETGGNKQYACGSEPSVPTTFSESQFLAGTDERIKVTLVTWS